jgi:prepilin-type N-terminal cleavage/methylation domain-containing protein
MNRQKGVTLIELMIVIAIVAIIGAIAIPAYNGYVQEAKYSTAMHNIESMRVFLEDYNLENGTYILQDTSTSPATPRPTPTLAQLNSILGWSPDGDRDLYTYSVNLEASSYDLLVTDSSDTSIWVLCNDRFTSCCDSSQFAAGTAPTVGTTACP